MNPLEARIRGAILANGPMPVSLYMLMCLHDPQHGYYATRAGFNRDFTTAPETSQVFGELIGAWAVNEWVEMHRPKEFRLIELGPGRGTMMADALRTAEFEPGFIEAMKLSLVEASPELRKQQADKLTGYEPEFFDGLEPVPAGPAIILANEFLDCLPVRQYVRGAEGWRERAVGIDPATDKLRFGFGLPAELPDDLIPQGDEVEAAPGLETLVDLLAQRFRQNGGRALFIDYGPDKHSPGDTLRAYSKGAQVDPLTRPGECDLTADVDFGRLKALAKKLRLGVHGPLPQGYFLRRIGAIRRAEQLAKANPGRADEIMAAVHKLTKAAEMGERFKVMCISPHDLPPAPAGLDRE